MNKKIMVFIGILAMLLCTGLASAQSAGPGTQIALTLNKYQITTTGLVITPSWKPAYVKWYLIDPTGNTRYMKQSSLDSVVDVSSGIHINSETWEITENSGTMKIPAFAGRGNWVVKCKLYDVNKILLIQWSNKAEFISNTVEVMDYPFLDNLMAPAYYVFINLGGSVLTGELEFSFALPDLIYFIAGIVILFFILINWSAFRSRRRKSNA